MGDEADYQLLQYGYQGPRVRRKKRHKPTVATVQRGDTLKMDKLVGEQVVVKEPPRTIENMPDKLKAELATMSEGMRAVRILSWLEDISFKAANERIQSFKRQQRAKEEAEERQRELDQKLEQLSAAKTLEDLKPLLSEIIEKLWS